MKAKLRDLSAVQICSVALILMGVTACSADAGLPASTTQEEVNQLVASRLEAGADPGKVRSFGLHLQQADGQFADAKGLALAMPRDDGAYDVAFYMPNGDGFSRIGDSIVVNGVRPPYVGNSREGGTCLRAKKQDGLGQWYGCVLRGEVVTGDE